MLLRVILRVSLLAVLILSAGSAAMAQTTLAKDRFYELVHETVAGATGKMSLAGRQGLADWRRRRVAAVVTQ